MSNIYDFEVTTINGKASKLNKYKGKVLLVVNTASKCGRSAGIGRNNGDAEA